MVLWFCFFFNSGFVTQCCSRQKRRVTRVLEERLGRVGPVDDGHQLSQEQRDVVVRLVTLKKKTKENQ